MTSTAHPADHDTRLGHVRATVMASASRGEPWPVLLADLLGDLRATWRESAEVCADVAWQARATGHSALLFLDPDHFARVDERPETTRALRHIHLSGLRYDFRCQRIEELLDTLPARAERELDCYTRALWSFALLGQSRTSGYPMLEGMLAEAGDHPKSLHVLLHGLWLGHGLPGREETMLRILAGPAFATGTDPIALFREAAAHRALGSYSLALAAIDRAMELLPPGPVEVHADFVRERSLITAAYEMRQLLRAQCEGRLR
ncbi:hypothetical protein [Streptomyces sp. SID1121]|uniref:hypothetical protein n=1 Tax=Streptomyces sp. SID1121 TaxID=3425888 RepID=UPI004055B9AD